MNVEVIRDWLHARATVKADETALKAAKADLAEKERAVLAEFEREGVASVRVDGMTVSLRRDVYASIAADKKDQAFMLLDELGLSDLAPRGISAASLSAHVREQERLGIPIEPALADIINVAEVFKASATKSTRG